MSSQNENRIKGLSYGAVCLLVVVSVFATSLTSNVIAQNTTSGKTIPTNVAGASSSPEAINNTLTEGVVPQNETVKAR
jgi:hypothetical protein